MRTHSTLSLEWEKLLEDARLPSSSSSSSSSSSPTYGIITIPCGTRVTMNKSANITGLIVQGHLDFSDNTNHPLSLSTNYIYVCGTLSIGTPHKPYSNLLDITLTDGERLEKERIDYGSQAFAVFGGFVYINTVSCHRPSWVRLTHSAYPKDSTITVDEDVSFLKKGDQLVITSTDYDSKQTQEITVDSIPSPQTISFSPPLLYPHSGVSPTRAEIGILSRNVKIHGAEECREGGFVRGGERVTNKPICPHFIISHTPYGMVCGVEFTNMGSHTTIGKYPLHAHMCGNAPNLKIMKNSIHHTFQRSMVIHTTSFSTIFNNIAYHSQGHMYVFENGFEVHNNVSKNLGILAFPPRPSWECGDLPCSGQDKCSFGTTITETTVQCGSRDDNFAEIFWVANPLNDLIDNVAVGGYRSGFSFYPVYAGPILDRPEEQKKAGLPQDQIEKLQNKEVKLYKETGARYIRSDGGVFRGNVVHSTRLGFSVYPQWNPTQQAIWEDILAYKIIGAGIRVKNQCNGPCLLIQNFTVLATSMGVRARDVYSHMAITKSKFEKSNDRAFLGGGCLNWLNNKSHKRGMVLKKMEEEGVDRSTGMGGVCSLGCGVDYPVSVPPGEYGSALEGDKRRGGGAMFKERRKVYAFNFGVGELKKGTTSEKCKEKSSGRSCYKDHKGNLYNETIVVDRETLMSLEREGEVCGGGEGRGREGGSFVVGEGGEKFVWNGGFSKI